MKLWNRAVGNPALRSAALYGAIATLWIAASDAVLLWLAPNEVVLGELQTLKGWAFVAVTTGLLYGALQHYQNSLGRIDSLLTFIVEGTTDAMFAKDRQGRYRWINPAAAQIFGRSPAEIVGQTDAALFPPDAAAQIVEVDRQVMAGETVLAVEERVPVRGEERTYWTTKFPWRDRRGQVQGIIGVARDATDKNRLERDRAALAEELQRQTRDLAALNAVTANSISTLELDDLLAVLLQRIVAVVEADGAILYLQANHLLQPRASIGLDLQARDRAGSALGGDFAGTVAARRQPLYVADARADPAFCNSAAVDRHSCSLLGVPLRRNGQLVGVLQVEWRRVRPCGDREIHLLEIVGERCTLAILNARLFEQTRALRDRLQLQIDRMPIGFIACDRYFTITDWNPAAERIFGYSRLEAIGRNPLELIVPPSARSRVESVLNRVARGSDVGRHINENLTKSGRTILCEWRNVPLPTDERREGNLPVAVGDAAQGDLGRDREDDSARHRACGILMMVQDVTDRQRSEENLWRAAHYDPITGLPNRALLIQRLEVAIDRGDQRPFALLYLDINRYKVLKYSLGHRLAEALLEAVARRLETCLRPPALLARTGTDEFALLAETVADLGEAQALAARIQRCLDEPFELDGAEIYTSAAVGLVLRTAGLDAEALLRAADAAMHRAKQVGGARVAAFDASMQAAAARRLQLDADLRRALDRDEFRLVYQPIVDLDDRRVVGFEALIRWHHPREGTVSPAEFVPLAEENGAIVPLGLWVLRRACDRLRQWQQRYDLAELAISVNLSAVQLKSASLLDDIDAALAAAQLGPQCLTLEITESTLIEDYNAVADALQQLQARGIRLSIDDFGTGYSSLSQLHSLPADSLKIDRAFVSRLEREPKNLEIARTITLLARSLDMTAVAEGVETDDHIRHLQALGCRYAQGYRFSRPLDETGVERLLATGDRLDD